MDIKCCKEHVDLAMEVIIDEYEIAPNIVELDQKLSTSCEYCQEMSTYLVSNEYSSTI